MAVFFHPKPLVAAINGHASRRVRSPHGTVSMWTKQTANNYNYRWRC
jgi:hypothetical protein